LTREWRIVICVTFCIASYAQAGPALALASFKKVFDEQYIKHSDDADFKRAFKKQSCNTCHINKKKRYFVNGYGLKLSKEIAGSAKDRLHAAQEAGGLKAKRAENDQLLKELKKAMKNVERMKVSDKKTYGELFESHQLPPEDKGTSLRPAAGK